MYGCRCVVFHREEVLKNKTIRLGIISVIISLLLAGIDQLTKWLVVTYLKPIESVSLIKMGDKEWLNLTYCENTGMSFSLLEGYRVVLIILPIILIGLVEWYIFSGKVKTKPMLFALAALAGGGFGNLIDRVFLGYVVDFIDVKIINFAIFNFADICAVLGGIFTVIFFLLEDSKDKKEEPPGTEGKEEKADE